MSTKRTVCDKCNSNSIVELNPEIREEINRPLCKVTCKCNDCNNIFEVPTWTIYGKRRGILY